MRVVCPPVAPGHADGTEQADFQDSDASVSGWPPLDASFDPHVAVQMIDTAATLSVPHPLYETLLRWAPLPQAFAGERHSLHAINQRSPGLRTAHARRPRPRYERQRRWPVRIAHALPDRVEGL
jgi:hypothetical protein